MLDILKKVKLKVNKMNSSKIKENKIIFLYAKTLQNLITEKDFSIDSSFSNFKCEKEIKKKMKIQQFYYCLQHLIISKVKHIK